MEHVLGPAIHTTRHAPEAVLQRQRHATQWCVLGFGIDTTTSVACTQAPRALGPVKRVLSGVRTSGASFKSTNESRASSTASRSPEATTTASVSRDDPAPRRLRRGRSEPAKRRGRDDHPRIGVDGGPAEELDQVRLEQRASPRPPRPAAARPGSALRGRRHSDRHAGPTRSDSAPGRRPDRTAAALGRPRR